MAQNQNGSNKSKGMCEKFWKILGIPCGAQNPTSTNTAMNLPIQNPSKVSPHQINPVAHKPGFHGNITVEYEKTEPKRKKSAKENEAGQEQEDESKFSDYIDQVKNKMRTMSNVSSSNGAVPNAGAKRAATRRDSFNDRVLEYINRTKAKIRTPTMDGNGKNISFKIN